MNQSLQPSLPPSAPVETDAEFQRQGAGGPARCDEHRRFPRFPYQTRLEATIHPLEASEGQAPIHCPMMTRDISRGGINLLHSEQLFPGQRIDIELNGLSRCVEVMWCRRIANRCYSAGCRFVARPVAPGELSTDAGG